MPYKTNPDFYQQVEEFIFKSVEEDTLGNNYLNNEIAMYLLSLLSERKKQDCGK